MILIKNLNYQFNGKTALQDLSLEVQSTSIHSLIGLTGAGKTLLLKVLAGLMPLQSGSILNPSKKISFVFQQNPFLPWLTMSENLQISTKQDMTLIKERLKEFRLDDYVDLYPKQLSGGTIQKFSLFRAFLISADLILLDEPFSHLDIIQKEDLYHFMLNLWQKQKPTILLVTHDIDEALMLSHSISFLSRKSHRIIETIQIKNLVETHSLNLLNYREDKNINRHYSTIYDYLKADLK